MSSKSPPICIVTSDRHHMLDVTLRSLSATNLPEYQQLTVFDDGSKNQHTLDYLYTDRQVPLQANFPTQAANWKKYCNVDSRFRGKGIADKVEVVKLNMEPKGVVRATCKAVLHMVEKYGTERGILMCQDDVVFKHDWLEQLQAAERKPHPDHRNVGLIAGCWINRKATDNYKSPMTYIHRGGITAQCYYVTQAGLESALPWVQQHHNFSKGFDNKFCAAVRRSADVYKMHPAICQHIGVNSLVRPSWRWHRWNNRGRVDYTITGPYAMGPDVRKFEGSDYEACISGT